MYSNWVFCWINIILFQSHYWFQITIEIPLAFLYRYIFCILQTLLSKVTRILSLNAFTGNGTRDYLTDFCVLHWFFCTIYNINSDSLMQPMHACCVCVSDSVTFPRLSTAGCWQNHIHDTVSAFKAAWVRVTNSQLSNRTPQWPPNLQTNG